MLSALFWLTVGAFVGWNFPRPAIAKNVQDKVVGFFKNLF